MLGCRTVKVTTLELSMTESRPLPVDRTHDDAEFDRRFAAARDRLARICGGLVGWEAADDVVHEAYLRGRARFGQLRDADLFEPWLTRLAVRLCLNLHRSDRRLRDHLPFLRPRERSPERDLGLRDLIERLPPRERSLVVLHYGHGYQLDEIAHMTGLSTGNARTILFRARRRLGDQLKDADR